MFKLKKNDLQDNLYKKYNENKNIVKIECERKKCFF